MRKKKTKKPEVKKYLPYGRVLLELVIWDFSQDERIIRHTANEIARAIQLSYSLSNFGTESFGLEGEE
jgi:hypothetical protein